MIHTDNSRGDTRVMRCRPGYFLKTWICRISRISVAAKSAIHAGHCTNGAIHNIQSYVNSVMNPRGGGVTPSVRVSRDAPPFRPLFSPQVYPLVGSSNVKHTHTPDGYHLFRFELLSLCDIFFNFQI